MNKKDLELEWLERAREVRPDLFAGDVITRETPDFVLVHRGIRKGVEVTRYVIPKRSGEPIGEEQTGLRRKIMRRSRDQFSKRSGTRLRVGAVFQPAPPIRAGRVPPCVDAIVHFLATRINGSPDWTRVNWRAEEDDSMPPELSNVFATVVPSIGNIHWYAADAGWVSNADDVEIDRIVAAKEPKVQRYRKQCDELSLLIVFEGTPHSARAVHAPDAPVSFSVSTGFDQILCLDLLEKRLVEIPIDARGA